MVRAILVLMVFAALLVVAWVVIRAISATKPVRPDSSASDAEWADFYRRLMEDAHRTGDTGSEALYESLMRTHLDLDNRNRA